MHPKKPPRKRLIARPATESLLARRPLTGDESSPIIGPFQPPHQGSRPAKPPWYAGQVLYPITSDGRFEVGVLGAAANVSYLEGMSLGQPWNSGVGCGMAYHSPSGAWHVLVGYGHGFNAPRRGERGANSLSLLVQYDFHKSKTDFQNLWRNVSPSNWRGISK